MKLRKYEVHYSVDGVKCHRKVKAVNEFGALDRIAQIEDGRHVLFDAVFDDKDVQVLYREQV